MRVRPVGVANFSHAPNERGRHGINPCSATIMSSWGVTCRGCISMRVPAHVLIVLADVETILAMNEPGERGACDRLPRVKWLHSEADDVIELALVENRGADGWGF